MAYDTAPDPKSNPRWRVDDVGNPYFDYWKPSGLTTSIAVAALVGVLVSYYFVESTPQEQICTAEEYIPAGKTTPNRSSLNKADLIITGPAPRVVANERNLVVDEGANIDLLKLCGISKSIVVEGTVGTLEIWGKDILVRARTTSRVTTIKVNADDCHIIDQSPHVFPPSSGCTSSKY